MNNRSLPNVIASLLKPEVYDHNTENIRLVETHISWVILTGPFAYKIKKTIDLKFLNFSTLEKRHHYCNEELRLNGRLASAIYLDVVAIRGPAKFASLSGSGEIIEYAIKMNQFPQQAQLDRMLESERLKPEHIDMIASAIADFHQQTEVADQNDSYGKPEQILKPVNENFHQIRLLRTDSSNLEVLKQLENWSFRTFENIKTLMSQRKKDGFVRECHGDLHLRNLVFIDHKVNAFDCIEFDPQLRWIDIISDIAFLIMDLQNRHEAIYANRLLNLYLEKTGAYAAIKLLSFYCVYRALVRAKVEAITASQNEDIASTAFNDYLRLASSYLKTYKPMLIITHGMSASGKTTLTLPLLERLPAIRIRSDVERKRLFAIDSATDSHAAYNAGIYSSKATQQIYQHLNELAKNVLDAGYSVIIDAAFLKSEQRQIFKTLANSLSIKFLIIEFAACADTLQERINNREKEMSDADQMVLEKQLHNFIPLSEKERSNVITIDTESPADVDTLNDRVIAYENNIQT